MRIRFDCPASVRIDFQPGDEVSVRTITPLLEAALKAPRLDGRVVAHLVGEDDEEIADITPLLEAALKAPRLDGRVVAHLVGEDDEEIADIDRSDAEVAVMGRKGRHAQRPASMA